MEEILKLSLIAYVFTALEKKRMPFHWYKKLICKLPWYLCKPLGGCYMCLTGEVCLWYLVFSGQFHWLETPFLVCIGIISSMIYNKIYCWLHD